MTQTSTIIMISKMRTLVQVYQWIINLHVNYKIMFLSKLKLIMLNQNCLWICLEKNPHENRCFKKLQKCNLLKICIKLMNKLYHLIKTWNTFSIWFSKRICCFYNDAFVMFWSLTRPKNAIPRWCTGWKWHIPMASNRKRSRGRIKAYNMGQGEGLTVPLQWCTGREWPVNCMTDTSAWWRLNIRFQRSSGWSCGRWIII